MTLDPYRPIPWESFTLVEPAPLKRNRRWSIYFAAAAIAIATGALIAASHIWGMT